MLNISVLSLLLEQEIEDFRANRGQRYRLHHLLTISVLAMLSGADDFEAMAGFAESREAYLCQNGLLKAGRLPSHDLFRWIFMMLDTKSLSKFLGILLAAMIEQTELKAGSSLNIEQIEHKRIHIDGKSLRATRTQEHSRTALQIVSAYCSDHHLSVGQLIIDGKSCEKTAIPQLIDLMDLTNMIVTIDAIATSKKNASKIIDKKGDYMLALKKNNRLFYNEVDDFFRVFKGTALISHLEQTEDIAHGRHEIRTCSIIRDLKYFADAEQWKGLKSIVCIASQRTIKAKTSVENRYYLSSLPPNAATLMREVRQHWLVENHLHWSLDVSFNEDKSRVKDKNAAFNLAALRRFCLAIIKNAKISEHSIKTQRLQAAWNVDFLDNLLKFLQKHIS